MKIIECDSGKYEVEDLRPAENAFTWRDLDPEYWYATGEVDMTSGRNYGSILGRRATDEIISVLGKAE